MTTVWFSSWEDARQLLKLSIDPPRSRKDAENWVTKPVLKLSFSGSVLTARYCGSTGTPRELSVSQSISDNAEGFPRTSDENVVLAKVIWLAHPHFCKKRERMRMLQRGQR